jgi:hypothetical protein
VCWNQGASSERSGGRFAFGELDDGDAADPEHFLRQDGYIDESLGWVLRHCVAGAGLVGGGVRLESGQRGLPGFDPRLELSDDGSVVRVSVLQARGIKRAARSSTSAMVTSSAASSPR